MAKHEAPEEPSYLSRYIVRDPWPTRARAAWCRLVWCHVVGHDPVRKMHAVIPCSRHD